MSKKHKPIIGITLGDINGVGPEVVLKALADNRLLNFIVPVIYGSTKIISFYKKNIELEEFHYTQVKDSNQFLSKKINVLNCWQDDIEITPGKSTKEGGDCARKALEKASQDLKDGYIDALVTAPINKENMQSDAFKFPGHTEYFTKILEAEESLMFMVSERLRVGVVTGHMPLKDVVARVDQKLVKTKLKIMETSLKKDFGITKPRIAVLGLNPHAGENGLLGVEEEEIITPIVTDFKKRGSLVFGPFSADGFFGSGEFEKFDGVLAMYHDQGLIPFKSLSFGSGVNYTAGLPAVRTSPDHGTGYGIAGMNKASEDSLRSAILAAMDVCNMRKENAGI